MTPATAYQDYELKVDSKRPQLLTSSQALDPYFRKNLREESPRDWEWEWRVGDVWVLKCSAQIPADTSGDMRVKRVKQVHIL
jgi:hypothetical protein